LLPETPENLEQRRQKGLWKRDDLYCLMDKSNAVSLPPLFCHLAAMTAECEIFNSLHFRSTVQRGGHGPSGPMVNTPVTVSQQSSPFLPRCIEKALFVRRSVKRVNCDKTEERSVQVFIPHERSLSLVFCEEEWLMGGNPFYLKFRVNWPRWSEITDFEPIFARSASAVTPSENSSINTNRKSTTRFLMSLR